MKTCGESRLNSAAQDSDGAILASELAGDHRGDRGGAEVGQMTGISEIGEWLAGGGGNQQHHAVPLAVKRGGHFQGEVSSSTAIARLHVNFTAGLDVEMHRHGSVAV